MTYYSTQTVRKLGLNEKTLIQVYEKDFPYPLAEFFAENNTFENWLITQNQKSNELKIFEKLVILFQQKREIHYGIYLALQDDKTINKEFSLGKSINEIEKIMLMIPIFYQAIQPNFLKLLTHQKLWFQENIEMVLFYELKDFAKQYRKIKADYSIN